VNGDGYVARRNGQGGAGQRWRLAALVRRGELDPRFRILCYNCNLALAFAGYCHGEKPSGDQSPSLPLFEVK